MGVMWSVVIVIVYPKKCERKERGYQREVKKKRITTSVPVAQPL